MSAPLPVSVLDQSPVARGSTSADALRNTLDLAQLCDTLGYHRYWMAEHHGTYSVAGVAPEVLIGPVALATKQIRVGSGGIMLPHYSPYKVAETFALLAALAPDRIDLGLGRAPGTDQRTAYALQRDRRERAPNDFPEALAELLAYYDDSFASDHPFAPLVAGLPSGGGEVAPWMLGSSADSAYWAAEAGLPYCIADFINSGAAPHAEIYRRHFKPSARLAKPYLMVCSWAIAADSAEEAERLAAPAAMSFAFLVKGKLIAVPPVDEAVEWLKANPEARGLRARTVLGTPSSVKEQLLKIVDEYGADELMMVNIMSDHAARRRSYELMATEFGLAPSGGAS